MKNLKRLFSIYTDFSSRLVIIGDFLFDRRAYLSRIAIEYRFAVSDLSGRWRLS